MVGQARGSLPVTECQQPHRRSLPRACSRPCAAHRARRLSVDGLRGWLPGRRAGLRARRRPPPLPRPRPRGASRRSGATPIRPRTARAWLGERGRRSLRSGGWRGAHRHVRGPWRRRACRHVAQTLDQDPCRTRTAGRAAVGGDLAAARAGSPARSAVRTQPRRGGRGRIDEEVPYVLLPPEPGEEVLREPERGTGQT